MISARHRWLGFGTGPEKRQMGQELGLLTKQRMLSTGGILSTSKDDWCCTVEQIYETAVLDRKLCLIGK